MFQTVLNETVNEFGKTEDDAMQTMLAKTINADPALKSRVQGVPEVDLMLEKFGGNNGVNNQHETNGQRLERPIV
jgi:hypothetical protein